jgi:hypothetical protein
MRATLDQIHKQPQLSLGGYFPCNGHLSTEKLLTNFDLANMLQWKALATASVPNFPQNCGKPCGFGAKVSAKSRFSRAL